jgi:hypothetical protein
MILRIPTALVVGALTLGACGRDEPAESTT